MPGAAFQAPPTRASAGCDSIPDGQAVGSVHAAQAGALQGQTLIVYLFLDPSQGSRVQIDLASGGSVQWSGAATVSDADDLRTHGRATFTLTAAFGGERPAEGSPPATASVSPWPATLTGALSWSCGAWIDPKATPVAPVAGTFTLVTPGVTWTPPSPGATVTCDSGGVTGPVGSLSGYGFTATLSLDGAQLAGHVNLAIRMDMPGDKNLPPGMQFLPSWNGDVRVTVLDSGARSGTVTFIDLPSGVDPQAGPAPTGFPRTLTGTLTWRCAGP
jgi:hypothetical protein